VTPIRTEPRFKRDYKKKPREMRDSIDKALVQLRADPHHPGLGTHRIRGKPGVWAANLDQGNRLTFHWDGETIVLRNHCNHDILKRNP
jgi:mRNA-degrading endonuclease YafQ of YafQ-DinJ toxin-antitoxin module